MNIDLIQQAADAGENIYEMAVAMGIEANDRMDAGRWLIGDLALLVNNEYGQNSIETFASDIRIEVGRVREYRTTCAYWENSVRTEFLTSYPLLKYSHFRIASKLVSFDSAVNMLRTAGESGWSTTHLYKEVKRILKPNEGAVSKLIDTELPILNIRGTDVTFRLTVAQQQALFDLWRGQNTVRLVVYTVQDGSKAHDEKR